MDKNTLYSLLIERLNAISQYSQLTKCAHLSKSDIDRLISILEQAEYDQILNTLMEMHDEKHTASLSELEKNYYDQQGKKFLKKLVKPVTKHRTSNVTNPMGNWSFLEIWIDPTALPPYVLMLAGYTEGNFAIYDPKEEYKIIFACSSYEEAKLWLLEDEYEQVEGRLSIDESSSF